MAKHPRNKHEDEPAEQAGPEAGQEPEASPPMSPTPPPATPAPPAPVSAPAGPATHPPALNADHEAALAEARKQATELAKQIGLGPVSPKRPEDIRKGDEEMVACLVPNDFTLTLDDRVTKVEFLAGIRKVPKSLLEHWYVKAQKVVAQKD